VWTIGLEPRGRIRESSDAVAYARFRVRDQAREVSACLAAQLDCTLIPDYHFQFLPKGGPYAKVNAAIGQHFRADGVASSDVHVS